MSQQDRAEARRTKIEAIRADDQRKAARRKNVMISLSVSGVFVVVLAVLLAVNAFRPGAGASGESRLVRADSHRLQVAPDGKVTLVEFLDFECGGCRAHYPVVERLRQQYAGKITFVVRHFPLAAHFNAMRAARAAEAAARQGRFEAMYRLMYETQDRWGQQRAPADEVFRGHAKALGLDMDAWDKAYDDPATLARVEKDAADGEAPGVQGTPTFFLNGTKIQPRSEDEFKAAIDAALAG